MPTLEHGTEYVEKLAFLSDPTCSMSGCIRGLGFSAWGAPADASHHTLFCSNRRPRMGRWANDERLYPHTADCSMASLSFSLGWRAALLLRNQCRRLLMSTNSVLLAIPIFLRSVRSLFSLTNPEYHGISDLSIGTSIFSENIFKAPGDPLFSVRYLCILCCM